MTKAERVYRLLVLAHNRPALSAERISAEAYKKWDMAARTTEWLSLLGQYVKPCEYPIHGEFLPLLLLPNVPVPIAVRPSLGEVVYKPLMLSKTFLNLFDAVKFAIDMENVIDVFLSAAWDSKHMYKEDGV